MPSEDRLGLLRVIVLGAIVAAISGCAPSDPETDYSIPPPKAVGLRPGDGLVVNLQSIPDPATINAQVDDRGEIALRFIGNIKVDGMTESELAGEIQRRYIDKKIYFAIDVSVVVTPRYVHVGGEVLRSGRVLWSPDLTLTKAIQEAGGFSVYAKKSSVIVAREGKSYTFDAKTAFLNPSKDMNVYPGDSINVPRSPY